VNRETKLMFRGFLEDTLHGLNGRTATKIKAAAKDQLKPDLDPDQWKMVLAALIKWLPLLVNLLKV